MFDQSESSIVDQSESSIVDQSESSIVDVLYPGYFYTQDIFIPGIFLYPESCFNTLFFFY